MGFKYVTRGSQEESRKNSSLVSPSHLPPSCFCIDSYIPPLKHSKPVIHWAILHLQAFL